MSEVPVLLVHGIWDGSARFTTMKGFLEEAGVSRIGAIDLYPNDGSAPIPELAAQVEAAARELAREHGAERIDAVGFSMGALVSRYFIQRLSGRNLVRRFVSISGPHRGTATAYASPKQGVRQMRPESELLAELDTDPDPWGAVEVHTFWTPFDLMILPPRSSRLPHARSEKKIPVALHRWMITDRRVLSEVLAVLAR